MKKERLGDLLVEAGVLTKGELEFALRKQRDYGGKLHEIIIELGYATEEIIMQFFGKRLGIDYIELESITRLEDEVKKKIPELICRKYCILPISIDKKNKDNNNEVEALNIATDDPLNVKLMDELHILTGCEIKTFIAPTAKIRDAIIRLYKF